MTFDEFTTQFASEEQCRKYLYQLRQVENVQDVQNVENVYDCDVILCVFVP